MRFGDPVLEREPPCRNLRRARVTLMNDVDWTRGAWVCGGWLLGDSVLGTWAICLQTARPFAYFKLPASMAAVVVEVVLVRSLAPCFVATAAWFGVCSATRAGTKFPYLAFLAAVALYPVPIMLGFLVCFAALNVGSTEGPARFWKSAIEHLVLGDFGAGFALTCVYVLALGALGLILPRTWLARAERGTRIFVTWCLGGVALGLVRVAFSLIRGAN